MMEHIIPRHIRLTSHPGASGGSAVPLCWGAANAEQRGPVVASLAETRHRVETGDIVPDGRVVLDSGEIRVTKAAIDPVWHLPGLAERFRVAEHELRRTLFEETGGMFSELVTRPDL